MHSRLEEIRENGLLRIANAESVEALQNVRRAYRKKRGVL